MDAQVQQAGRFTTRALDADTWPAFARLVEANGGVFGGCWCIGFHPEGPANDAELNRERKHQRVLDGTTHAALVFDGDDCVGWVQFGPPEEVFRIKNRPAYEKTATGAPPDWRIGCNYVGKGHRRQGVSAAGLAGALELIAGLGGGVVEGYPEPADAVSTGFLFHGALSTFEDLGFERDRQIGKHRWVVRKVLPAAAGGRQQRG